ncbi:MAG: amidohydrolase family protein [Wenzhouxiangellaceae bacterium]|nr:amidohydrolase family protein [Wenzhouxiangellaceae bacterium]
MNRVFRQALVCALTLLVSVTAAADYRPDVEAWAIGALPPQSTAVVRNATLWTATADGILEQADLLVRAGKIVAVGRDLDVPRGALDIDGTGLHVTPGIIDAHSHAAIIGGVNEATDISTAQVRIEDVIDAESINIYRQLAGGVTTINLLHGSANAIGGQMAVIKLRWGADPAGLLFDAAAPGIKFALGENPKQSNWDNDHPRYPQTRPGVAQIIDEKFQQAADYARQREAFPEGRRARDRVPPRPDLEMDAIAEILAGVRKIHSHAYRADEMRMLITVAEAFGITVGTFQHVLEGYKLARRMAEHGAGGSGFIDWWNFKHEASDAIPYNPALMAMAGVTVGLHSDNPELARRMNLEAAKAVRYGGVDEHEAVKMITANPADQLGVGNRTGRLAAGMDADFVLWNGHPLSVYSRVEQTWVDGRRFFDRETDLAARAALDAERQQLLAKVLADDEADSEAESEASEDEPGLRLIGYRESELAHDQFCHAQDFGHVHGIDFRRGNR